MGRRPAKSGLAASFGMGRAASLPCATLVQGSEDLELVARIYGTLDAIPEMRMVNLAGPGVPYACGGWINEHIARAYDAFRQAKDHLGDFVADLDRPLRLIPQPLRRAGRALRRLRNRPDRE
jgi:hypothetical protein